MATATAAIPERTLGVDDEPPPYTPNPNVYRGESTVEYGPSRPHGPVRPRPRPQPQPQQPQNHSPAPLHPAHTGASSSLNGRNLGSLWNQFREQAQVIAENVINEAREARNRSHSSPYVGVPPQRTGGSSWSAFPGNAAYRPPPPPPMPPRPGMVPPPPHPPLNPMGSRSFHHLPSTNTPPQHEVGRRASSDFARDFYAVGGDVPNDLVSPGTNGPHNGGAHGPGKPTNEPVPGHPLLNEGQLLVYPKGYECSKCHNIGYKIPGLKPCRKCWPKYGKPFTGPLAYSFSSPGEMNAENFQRPLPPHFESQSTSSALRLPPPPPPLPPRPGFSSAPVHSSFGHHSPHGIGGYGHNPVFVPGRSFFSPGYIPPIGSRVYVAGDSRIGGRVCWRCDGSGTVSLFLIDRDQCPVCGGLGRTFN